MSEKYRSLQEELRSRGELFEDKEFPLNMNGYVVGSASEEYAIRRDDLRKMGTLYEDPDFLVGAGILPKDLGDFRLEQVQWLRPKVKDTCSSKYYYLPIGLLSCVGLVTNTLQH